MTNYKSLLTHTLAAIFFIFSSCSNNNETILSGSIDYLGSADFYIEIAPLHYKYSEKIRYPISVNDGEFMIGFNIEKNQIIHLVIQDVKYPIYVEPQSNTEIEIKRASFPADIELTGVGSNANQNYQDYLIATEGLEAQIKVEMDKYKVGQTNSALALSSKKLELSKLHLKGTSLNDLYLKTIGEHFVIRLRGVEYSGRFIEDFDANAAREKILSDAVESGFFSYESLKAQRAGIRDFTHYYSRTFGIYDIVNQKFGKTLAEYDIKREAYFELNEKRMQVIEYITEPKAKAYAELFLVAERIGEIPFDQAEPSYLEYLDKYQEYPEFIDFITWFHDEIKSVSPGQPAIPFSLPNLAGEISTMDDFEGKFVLLDFWAGWCQPCLEEFPIMREIYDNYTRSDLEIVGISTEVDSLVWVQDINRFKNPWPQLYGGNGFNQETFKAYKGGGIPFYILVDPDGNIIRYNDMRPSFNFTEVLDSLLFQHQTQKASL